MHALAWKHTSAQPGASSARKLCWLPGGCSSQMKAALDGEHGTKTVHTDTKKVQQSLPSA